MSTNRNKRSLTLDITTAEGQAILQRMVDGADIFVNNLPRFSSMQKLGSTRTRAWRATRG